MKSLSIIILNYNTKELLLNCLKSIDSVKDDLKFKTIVCDNGSTDGSLDAVRNDFPEVTIIENKDNIGYAAGNNRAKSVVSSEFVLFLNSDTEVSNGTLDFTVNYLKENEKVGAVTCKTILPNGELDRDARRSFPTPWVALTHFCFLDRIFPTSKLLSQYWYGYKNPNESHEVDVLQGAFFLTRKSILDEVGWFSEEYFLDGEDIDLSWKIKEKGYKIMYLSQVSILHVKKASKNKNKMYSVSSGLNSMEIFYRKYLWRRYPLVLNLLVMLGIRGMKVLRFLKLHLS
jgi:GT2 family glycosyltransferase